MSWISGLAPTENDNETETDLYRKGDVRAHATEIIELPDDAFLAVHVREELHVSFACFEWNRGKAVKTSDDDLFQILFHGEGPSGNLRECRHTYWGEKGDGYLFYPPADVISAAMTALKRWFAMS